jgi:hypothetical protein
MPEVSLREPAVFAFVILPLALLAALLWGTSAASRRLKEDARTRRRAVLVTALTSVLWMALSWFTAESGVLRRWDATAPPFALLVLAILCVTCLLACTDYGRRLAIGLPLWVLVGAQGFRYPLELAMHSMYERGVMPGQMSYSGRNFDIVTGITAVVVSWLVYTGRAGRGIVLAWNIAGLALVLNVVTVGILSTPRFRFFGDDRLNVFITYTPFIWLPTVMVVAALAGHLIVFRALATQGERHPTDLQRQLHQPSGRP